MNKTRFIDADVQEEQAVCSHTRRNPSLLSSLSLSTCRTIRSEADSAEPFVSTRRRLQFRTLGSGCSDPARPSTDHPTPPPPPAAPGRQGGRLQGHALGQSCTLCNRHPKAGRSSLLSSLTRDEQAPGDLLGNPQPSGTPRLFYKYPLHWAQPYF